jgi:hypothetical protein
MRPKTAAKIYRRICANEGKIFMSIRMHKPWLSIAEATGLLRGNLGVYQLADEHQQVLYIGYAGGKSLFGLKGEVGQALQRLPQACLVRWEVTSAYLTRYKELLMLHRHDFGELPDNNEPLPLGVLRPAG